MGAASILYQRTAQEIADAVRRLLNDTDTEKVGAPDEMVAELVISQYIFVAHELGWDPVVPTRPDTAAPDSLLTYNLAIGDFQTVQEGHSDVVAMSDVYHNQSNAPMRFTPRHDIEARYNNDIRSQGFITRGIPQWWSIRVDHTSSGVGVPAQRADEYKHRMLVYPAADRATIVYWPRTIVDTQAVDPSSATARIPFSYLATEALKFQVASIIVRALNDDQLQLLKLSRGFADQLQLMYQRAIQLERAERAQHVLSSSVQEFMA